MAYLVKELFFTLQGEGARTGRAAVFLRFAGCNLWTGREADRERAVCKFCDTEFVGMDGPGGGRFDDPASLAASARALFPSTGVPYVVCTGGEPLLQLDEALIDALHAVGFEVAIETNGTLPAPPGIDWICVSPKAGSELVQKSGQELKLVHPQEGAPPEAFEALRFEHFFLQPMHGLLTKQNTERVVAHCRAHPRWRLSLQTHKLLGIP
jgi:7-carboxy-7-deazaguanine synthase (Cx14CxxC type)